MAVPIAMVIFVNKQKWTRHVCRKLPPSPFLPPRFGSQRILADRPREAAVWPMVWAFSEWLYAVTWIHGNVPT